MKGEKLQNICHSGLLIMGGTRFWGLMGWRRTLSHIESPAIWSLSWFCPCLGWWCRARQSQKARERQQVKLPQAAVEACDRIAEGRSIHYQPCDCFIDCDTTTEQLTKGQCLSISERYSWSKSLWYSISDFGPADQNASSLSPFEKLRQSLELGVFLICAWALVSQISALRVIVAMWASSLASPVCPRWCG